MPILRPIDKTLPLQESSQGTALPTHEPLRGFGDSSVTQAKSVPPTYRPSKPSLDPPVNPIFATIQYHAVRTETVYGKWLQIKELSIEKQFTDIQSMHTEQAKQLELSLEASKKASCWSVLEDVSNTLSASMSFFFGTSATLAGNPIIGGALITSGILSIGNLAFKHSHIWDWTADQMGGANHKLREQIRTYLPSAIGLAATGLAFAGSYGSWKYATQTGWQMTNHLIKTSADIADGLIKYRAGTTKADHNWKLADLNALQTNTDLFKVDLALIIEDVQQFHEHQTDMHITVGKILEERDRAIQLVQQPV